MLVAGLFVGLACTHLASAQKKPNWSPTNLTHTTEPGQTGYNDCGTGSSQDSNCQTMYINSINDFCIWAPPSGPQVIGDSEEYEVAWCTTAGRGTRVIPDGALKSVHFIQTPHFIQITGHLDGTMLNIVAGDEGGELDPHGMSGAGNPIGSVVFSTAFGGGVRQVKEWMNFMGDGEFCFRACNPSDPNGWLWCQHIYDEMGCTWVMPGNYDGGFDTCQANSPVGPPGVYGQSTFQQGQAATPIPHLPGASSQCSQQATIQPALVTAAATASASSGSVNASSSPSMNSSSSRGSTPMSFSSSLSALSPSTTLSAVPSQSSTSGSNSFLASIDVVSITTMLLLLVTLITL